MSIVVNLRYTGVNGNAAKFAQEMEKSGTADLIRAEDGNLRYEYYIPMNDPETVLLIDASPMMQTIASLREKYDLHMTAERYLSDDAGFSAHDSSFIRN